MKDKIYEFFEEMVGEGEEANILSQDAIDTFKALLLIAEQNDLFGLRDVLGCLPERNKAEQLLYEVLGPLSKLQFLYWQNNAEKKSVEEKLLKAIFGPDKN